MSEHPYAIPVEELLRRVWVPEDALVEVHADPQGPPADWSAGGPPYGDGMSGDADGD